MYLFSTGDDGCLCIFDIKKLGPAKPEKASKSKVLGQHVGGDEGVKEKSCELRFQDFGLGYADEILVTRQFLDEKQDRISVSLEGGGQQHRFHCFKIRFGCFHFNSFCISFVSGHKAIYIITEQVVDRLLSVNSSLRRRFWNLNDESGSLKLLFLGCALLGHQA